jgi:hypothetical protein
MNRVHIGGFYYLNQGDASPIIHFDVDKMYRYGKRLRDPDILSLAVSNLTAAYVPATVPAIFDEVELRAQPGATARLLRDTWLPDSCIMAARVKAESTDGLYLACIAADNGKSHSHNDTGNFWVYSNGLPVLIDLGQESYQKKSFDAHRYEIPSTQSAFHNLPTIGGVQQGVGPMFRATDLVYRANDKSAELGMELSHAYPEAAQLKSWRRTVRLDRAENTVVIDDAYFLAKPVSEISLSLMTACTVIDDGKGRLKLVSAQGAPVTYISFDSALLTAAVVTIPLDNAELKTNWGAQVYRILLKASGDKTAGKFKLVVSSI